MPIREFKCPKCNTIEERIVKHGQTRIVYCPRCLGDFPIQMNRIDYSVGAFHLHGGPGGWEKPSPAAKRIVNPDDCGVV